MANSQQHGQGSAALILVVDDDWLNRELLDGVLALQGYTVQLAASGEAALKFVAQQTPDLALVDIRMPGMDGFEVCRRLKALQSESGIFPIIMMSGLEGSQQERESAREAGADDFFPRTGSMEELVTRIAGWLPPAAQTKT